jgi:quercetin dioxygenase-like cupin family protein
LPVVHNGHEFVYCLEGRLIYEIEEQLYLLEPGDSLLFEAHLPHRWMNAESVPSRSLLVLCPGEERGRPVERHFTPERG